MLIAVNVSLPSERLIHGKLGSMAFLVKSISSDDPTLLLIGAMAARSTGTTWQVAESAAEPQVAVDADRTTWLPDRRDSGTGVS